jgi:hypothetical protein
MQTMCAISDPLHSCLESISSLPEQLLLELDTAWQSLETYETELNRWHEQLQEAQRELLEAASLSQPTDHPPMGTARSEPTHDAPVDIETLLPAARTVSNAARQFAALRRQRTGQRPQP